MRPSYHKLIEDVADGSRVESRYGSTFELINVTVDIEPGHMIARRGFNHKLAFMELLQVLAGIYNFEAIEKVAPKAALGLFSAEGAYGPRLEAQLGVVVDTLVKNHGTRQAVAFIGRPEDTCTNSLPCTEHIHFLIRNQQLYVMVGMRSWDLLKGLPYDLTVFGGLAIAIGRVLGMKPVRVFVTAGSAHYYLDDAPLINGIYTWSEGFRFTQDVPRTWEGIKEWAHGQVHSVLSGDDLTHWPNGIRLVEGAVEDA